jgi:hypothetical protein
VTLPDLLQVWPAVLDAVAPTNTQLAVGLRDARPIALVGREVTVAFDTSHQFQSKIADQAANREVLGEAIRALTGLAARPTIEVHDLSELEVPGEEPAAPPPSPDDWVDRIKHEFDAEEIIPETDQP